MRAPTNGRIRHWKLRFPISRDRTEIFQREAAPSGALTLRTGGSENSEMERIFCDHESETDQIKTTCCAICRASYAWKPKTSMHDIGYI